MSTKSRLCEICMKPIHAERLETIPETRLCAEHGERMDREFGGEFKLSFTTERLSKPGSLKNNYGGVTPSKTRNREGIEKLKDAIEDEKWRTQQT